MKIEWKVDHYACHSWVAPDTVPSETECVWMWSYICDVWIICIANFYPFLPNLSLPLSHDIPGPAQPPAQLLSLSLPHLSVCFSPSLVRFPRSSRMAAHNELCKWGPNYGSPPPAGPAARLPRGRAQNYWRRKGKLPDQKGCMYFVSGYSVALPSAKFWLIN